MNDKVKYYSLEYPNHTKLIMKSDAELVHVVKFLRQCIGVSYGGAIYNPESFLVLMRIYEPDERQILMARDFHACLVWE